MPPKRSKRKAAAASKPAKKAKVDDKEAESSQDYSKLKAAELKAECSSRGLSASGTKAVMIARLQANDEGEETKEAAAPAKKTATKAKAKKGGRGKKKADDDDEEDLEAAAHDQMAKLAKKAKKGGPRKAKVDEHVPSANSYTVYSDGSTTYDVMLNQTNITGGRNNNKFYVIQLLQAGSSFRCWTRWGRVGEGGQNSMLGGGDLGSAMKAFEKKFKDKTKNSWDNRANFKKFEGKYDLVEMADEDDEVPDAALIEALDGQSVKTKTKPCTLDKQTQAFMGLIFNNNMFKDAMQEFKIDLKKMPLGALSQAQIAKGYAVLEEMQAALVSNRGKLPGLSAKFYTTIPHDFGRKAPPVIGTAEAIQQKKDMLIVLGDIEVAQKMLKGSKKPKAKASTVEVDHPLDKNYQSLNADLHLLKKDSKEFKVIQKYTNNTMPGGWYKGLELQDVWSLDRHGEAERFKPHNKLKNRKLLWHGTNVAVVAAILGSGLRIMPHSGGRVGKGIYLASEQAKSAGYVGCAQDGKQRTGVMFLVEAALGKEHHITRDDSSLRAAPKGFDSIVAKGYGEPDPKQDTTLKIDGLDVTVPQGKRIDMPQYKGSSFDKSEYLLYNESQHRIRYVLKFKWG